MFTLEFDVFLVGPGDHGFDSRQFVKFKIVYNECMGWDSRVKNHCIDSLNKMPPQISENICGGILEYTLDLLYCKPIYHTNYDEKSDQKSCKKMYIGSNKGKQKLSGAHSKCRKKKHRKTYQYIERTKKLTKI